MTNISVIFLARILQNGEVQASGLEGALAGFDWCSGGLNCCVMEEWDL